MKLFKRTTIFLIIFIALVWSLLFVWVYYPLENVRVSSVEKQQVSYLLDKYNVIIPDGVLETKIKAVKTPKVTYLAKNKELFDKAQKKGKLQPLGENTYEYDGGTLTVENNTVILEGESKLIEKNTTQTALGNSRKLISWMGLESENMISAVYERQDGILVTYTPEYKGKSVIDCKISVMMYGAKRYKVTAVPVKLVDTGQKELPVSVCAALADFAMLDTSNGADVSSVSLCYKLNGEYLTPVWEIKTEDEEIYYN